MDRKYGILLLACCIVCVVISGCTGPSKQNPAGSAMDEEMYFSGSWILAEAIITYYDDQGSRYISQQRHQIFTSSSAIIITATEPEGKYVWALSSNGNFKTFSGDPAKLPIAACSREIAQAIVLSFSAAGGFLGDKAGLMQDPISIAGRMYQPIVIDDTTNSPTIQKVYREISSNLIDWVEIKNPKENILIAAKSYNLRKIADSDKLIPATIEIYNTDKSGRPADRIMKIEYKSFELSPTE